MLTIRTAQTTDTAAVDAIGKEVLAELRKVYRPNQKGLQNKESLNQDLERFVAVYDGQVVGTIQCYICEAELNLLGLGVLSEFRRRGVARKLIQHLEERARRSEMKRLRLYTVKQTGNVEVFQKLGFVVVAERATNFFESDLHAELIEVEMMKQV